MRWPDPQDVPGGAERREQHAERPGRPRRGPGPCRAPLPQCSRTAAAHTAATTASPTGRVSPASAASRPAVTQRPVSTAYSDQAASAVNSDSLYAIDCTIPTGSTAHSSTAQTPARRPYTWSATAKIPQAAASEASSADQKPGVGVRQRGRREQQPLQPGQQREERQVGVDVAVRQPHLVAVTSSATRVYQSESQRADSSVCALLPRAPLHRASASRPRARTAAYPSRARGGPRRAGSGAVRRVQDRSRARLSTRARNRPGPSGPSVAPGGDVAYTTPGAAKT